MKKEIKFSVGGVDVGVWALTWINFTSIFLGERNHLWKNTYVIVPPI